MDSPGSGRALEEWEECLFREAEDDDEDDEDEEEEEEDGLESPFRPSSSLRELNSSSCRCSSDRETFPLAAGAAEP